MYRYIYCILLLLYGNADIFCNIWDSFIQASRLKSQPEQYSNLAIKYNVKSKAISLTNYIVNKIMLNWKKNNDSSVPFSIEIVFEISSAAKYINDFNGYLSTFTFMFLPTVCATMNYCTDSSIHCFVWVIHKKYL